MRKETMKLFKVTLRGMRGWSTGVTHGISYVVTNNHGSAYEIVRDFLDKRDLGFAHSERELKTVELIAEANDLAECKCMLFVEGTE
jgi:hypothetical protein